MGLPELWDTIRDFEEVKPIAQLAEEHYKQHGRSLRIAIDEADWRFNNLSQIQVYEIRDASDEQAFRGVEKAMFYRICKLLTRNIQLIFVFDGPGVPAKRGRNGGRRIDHGKRRDLQTMLRCFNIPYQEAPGEAEAECARLQILGLVDAVWSQDSDCLMFGCGLWIHDNRVAKGKGDQDRNKKNTTKSDTNIRVVRANDMKVRMNLDREGLVLFAMIAGGDYHEVGLRGCGATIALRAVKEGSLAKSLCLCRNQRDCVEWGRSLAAFFRTIPRAQSLAVPPNFPDYKILQKYYRPKVTADELLMTNKRLDLSIARPIKELELLGATSSMFNIWGRRYMNWVGPVLLTRSLVQRVGLHPKKAVHDIKLVKQRASKSEDVMALRLFERKIKFSPFGVTSLRREDLEGGKNEGMWDGALDVPFDSSHLVECHYFPAFWLQQALPPDVLDPSPPSPKKTVKRKKREDADVCDERPAVLAEKRQKVRIGSPMVQAARTSQLPEPVLQRPQSSATSLPSSCPQTVRLHTIRNNKATKPRPSKLDAGQAAAHTSGKINNMSIIEHDDDTELRLPPARKPKKSMSLRESLSYTGEPSSPELSMVKSEELARAIHLSKQSPHLAKETPIHNTRSPSVPRIGLNQAKPLTSSECSGHILFDTARDRSLSASTSGVTAAGETDRIRAARLKYFLSSPIRTYPRDNRPDSHSTGNLRSS